MIYPYGTDTPRRDAQKIYVCISVHTRNLSASFEYLSGPVWSTSRLGSSAVEFSCTSNAIPDGQPIKSCYSRVKYIRVLEIH